MKKLLCMGLVIGAMFFNCVPTAFAAQFSDTKGHWGEKYISTLVDAGGISGYPDGTFRPDASITKAEFVSIILGVTGNKPEINGDWNASVMEKARDVNLCIAGTFIGEDTTAPYPIDRGDASIILVNAARNLRNETIPYNDSWDSSKVIKDISNAEQYAREDIESCYALGIMNGDENGNYNPRSELTRAEASLVVCRLIGAVDRAETSIPTIKETAQYTPLPDGSNVGSSGTVYPYEGATDINTGKVITRDANTGVLGFGNGQNGNIYYGIDAIDFNGNKVKIKDGTPAVDSYDNFGSRDVYTVKNGYAFWTSEWIKIQNYAREKLPTPNASMLGTKADINGNIIPANDTQTPAFWEVQTAFDVYIWVEI